MPGLDAQQRGDRADAFTPALDRLRAVKRRHDPDALVRSNFPVAG
ncbi:hypothetical protein [Micromonospora tulbaghiae]